MISYRSNMACVCACVTSLLTPRGGRNLPPCRHRQMRPLRKRWTEPGCKPGSAAIQPARIPRYTGTGALRQMLPDACTLAIGKLPAHHVAAGLHLHSSEALSRPLCRVVPAATPTTCVSRLRRLKKCRAGYICCPNRGVQGVATIGR
jgi:hypothetical protein